MILDRLNPRFICDAYVDLLTTTQGIFAVILWLVTAVLAVVLVWQIVLLIKAVLTTLAITAIVALVPFVWRGIGRLFEWVSTGRFCYAA
jgi:hypothetical protein